MQSLVAVLGLRQVTPRLVPRRPFGVASSASVRPVALAAGSRELAARPRRRRPLRVASSASLRALGVALAILVAGSVAEAAPRPRGELAVTIASSNDASPGVLDAHARQRHAEVVRHALAEMLRRTGTDARHPGVPHRQLNVTIVSWHVVPGGARIEVATELRVVICDAQGKMLAIMTGRARVSIPRDPRAPGGAALAELREQALAEAVGGLTDSLHQQLTLATS